jgi:hypothetical protein
VTLKKWFALARDIASSIGGAADTAGIEQMVRDGIPATPTSKTPEMDKIWHDVYCDGERLGRHEEYHLAKSVYDNISGVSKELYRVEPDQVAVILHKESYGVVIK